MIALLDKGIQFSDFDSASLESLVGAEECLLIQGTSAPVHGDDLSHLVPALKGFRGAISDLSYGYESALYNVTRTA